MPIRFKFHPRAWLDPLPSYPRFLGTIKPELMKAVARELAPRLASIMMPKQLERLHRKENSTGGQLTAGSQSQQGIAPLLDVDGMEP